MAAGYFEVLSREEGEKTTFDTLLDGDIVRAEEISYVMRAAKPHAPERHDDLCQAIEAGLLARERLETAGDSLPETDCRDLAELVRAGRLAMDDMVRHNLPLVAHVAVKYTGKGVPLADLVHAGIVGAPKDNGETGNASGLIQAIMKYDWQKGFAFSTYALPWINQALQRTVRVAGSMVRYPHLAHNDAPAMYEKAKVLQAELGRRPTRGELQSALGWTAIRTLGAYDVAFGHNGRALSTDAPVGASEDAATLGDMLAGCLPDQTVPTARQLFDSLKTTVMPAHWPVIRLWLLANWAGYELPDRQLAEQAGLPEMVAIHHKREALRRLRQRSNFADYLD